MKQSAKIFCGGLALAFACAATAANARMQDNLKGKDVPEVLVNAGDLAGCMSAASEIVSRTGADVVICRQHGKTTAILKCDDRTQETVFGNSPTDRFVNPAHEAGFHCRNLM